MYTRKDRGHEGEFFHGYICYGCGKHTEMIAPWKLQAWTSFREWQDEREAVTKNILKKMKKYHIRDGIMERVQRED